ncbi:hypothetical protein N431DRAFT_221630 [Stipitochalara longipes BDJ]|nr:hypothetical protein N431DRAFT_221630 [Stipitochalara longipes BDJ]
MGVMQRSLGPMAGGVSPLRTPFMAALIALCLIWSILSLDISMVRSTVEPVYAGVVDTMQQAEDEAIRLALGSSQGDSESSNSEATPVVIEVPSEIPTSTPNTVEQAKESNEAGKETPAGETEPVAAQDKTSDQLAQAPTEAPQDVASNTSTISPLPLVLYAYSESETARPNLDFFIRHALNSAADFVFILNGLTDAASIIPKLPNIKIVQRDNDCYDLGAYAEVLQKNDLWKGYGKFIMLNASLRGPFMPYWSDTCWMDMYLRKLTEEVKLVGMTANCWPTFHVQSMIWATDSIGLSTLLFPPEHAIQYLNENPVRLPPAKNKENLPSTSPALLPSTLTTRSEPNAYSNTNQPGPAEHHNHLEPEVYRYLPLIHQEPGINQCFHTWDSAVAAEVSSTALIKAAGYKVDVLMAAFHGIKELEAGESCEENGDVLFEGGYFGGDISVWETGWWKTNREVGEEELERQTEWVGKRGYSSWDFCRA